MQTSTNLEVTLSTDVRVLAIEHYQSTSSLRPQEPPLPAWDALPKG